MLKGKVKSLWQEQFLKERVVSALIFLTYALGNLIEYFSGKLTDDSPIFWILALVFTGATFIISFTKWKEYTSIFFKVMLVYINFQVAYVYGQSTVSGQKEAEPFYLMTIYVVFVIVTQVADTRAELVLIALSEAIMVGGVCYVYRDSDPILLEPLQLLMLGFVLVGSVIIGFQRLRLTQVAGGAAIHFRALTENARDIQSIINKDYGFVYINPSVKEIAGYTPADLQKQSLLTMVAEEDRSGVKEALKELTREDAQKKSVEYRIITKEGQALWVESIFSPFKGAVDKSGPLIFAETRDIEVRKKLEEEIQYQMRIEELLIKHSNNFINVSRTEIHGGIDQALGEFGRILGAEGVMVYRIFGKLSDEFRSSNQWFMPDNRHLNQYFNLIVHINQQLISFLRGLNSNKSSKGEFINAEALHKVDVLNVARLEGKRFYTIPLQSGNVVNGFVIFLFNEDARISQSSFFGLVGNMIANAFTRLRTETRLHEAQLTNEFILRALPDWLYIVDKNGEFTGTNQYSTLDPYIPDHDLAGKNFYNVLPDAIAAQFNDALNEVIETDFVRSFEYQDTSIRAGRFFKVILAPFKANEYLVIIRDITDLKTAQLELESKARKLELSNRELEEFAYVVSHDMKQPIRTIISYLSLLRRKYKDSIDAEGQEYINFSIEGANKMSDLIRDILQYSRMEQQLDFIKEVDLNSIVNKVYGGLKEAIQSNNAKITCDSLPVVKGNDTMLLELFQNLIENGMKYNRNETKTVDIKLHDKGQYWQFDVSDNGIGFEEKYADQIFKIFKRLHSDNEFQGTGIGLAVCQKAIEKHGGRIWANSVPGQGSTFHFTLPK
ncbi:MAG: ATP-binding protein [Chitinophagales bacterium]